MVSPGTPRAARSGETMRSVLDAVTEFRVAASSQALIDQAPEVIARAGFDRVLISRVVDGVWLPESMFVRTDARWADAIIDAGREEPTVLGSVVESDVVSSGDVFVVDEVQTHPRVHRQIARVSRSDNYGVAPIALDSIVVGMVHADCYFQQRPVSRGQCDTLAVLAESLAAHLGRLLLREQLQALREMAGRPWSAVAPVERPGEPGGGRTAAQRVAAAHPSLTDREVDVIRLMAGGETNYAIGRRLAISEGTVKTHVSNILHKLDAANRAHAVSLWASR